MQRGCSPHNLPQIDVTEGAPLSVGYMDIEQLNKTPLTIPGGQVNYNLVNLIKLPTSGQVTNVSVCFGKIKLRQ